MTSTRSAETNSSSSILISILYLVGIIVWPCNFIKHRHRRGRPYVWSQTNIIQYFIVCIWFRSDSNRSLHYFLSVDLPYNRKILKVCGLTLLYLPSRRTFDKRLKTISFDIKERISTMGHLFVSQIMNIAKVDSVYCSLIW